MTVSSRLLIPAAFWIGVIGAVVALWLSGQAGDAWARTRSTPVAAVLLVVAIGMLLPVIHALRWRVVMRALDVALPATLAADITVSSSLVNYASPGFLGAPAKAFLANRSIAAPYPKTLLSMAFEQGLDFLVLLIGSLIAGVLLGPERLGGLVPDVSRSARLALIVAGTLAILALLAIGRGRVERAGRRIVDAFRALGDTVDRPAVASLTLAYWLAQVAVVAILLVALDLPAGLRTILALSTIPLLVGQIAPLPGGVGAREAAIVALSGATGVSATGLLGLAVLQRVLLVAALPLSLGLARLVRVMWPVGVNR